jgi:8-oxo-dGTP pyrophosphatase MutT (NUDIX family)
MTAGTSETAFKRPESVLVVVYTASGKVLLLKRQDHPEFWQSVTGSLAWDETDVREAAVRELKEETGIEAGDLLRDAGLEVCYEIFPQWRYRYAPGVTHNIERVFTLELADVCEVALSAEHSHYAWFDFKHAAAKTMSWSNRCAIQRLARRNNSAQATDAIVLVHGLWLAGWAMALLAWRLRRSGYRTFLYSYPSVGCGLRENAEKLRAFVDAIDAGVLHLIGHSLGGVVIHTMLECCPPPQRGRVVTLGSPHRGTAVAREIMRHAWGSKILGRSVRDLLHRPLPSNDVGGRDIGVIKGTRAVGLGRLFLRLDQPNDGVVTVAEASWPGATDELELVVAHTEMLWSSAVAQQAEAFLRRGRFPTPQGDGL